MRGQLDTKPVHIGEERDQSSTCEALQNINRQVWHNKAPGGLVWRSNMAW